jgi:esterase/lipase superfamily enzyme
MGREYYSGYSSHLGRNMEMLVLGHAGARVLVFPTRCGRFYDYEDWGISAAIRHKLDDGWLQLFCVESVDDESFYCDWCPPRDRVIRHLQYEAYIINEVIPFTVTRNNNPALIAHGCSMGAYHAVNIAFRYPHLFCKVVAFSGRFDLTLQAGSFRDLLDGYYDDNIYFNTPSHFIPNISDPELIRQIRQLEITLVTGEEDAFLENNRHFESMLREKGLNPQLHIWSGEAHRARYWREMVLHYLWN